jgi:hypothetical protein
MLRHSNAICSYFLVILKSTLICLFSVHAKDQGLKCETVDVGGSEADKNEALMV